MLLVWGLRSLLLPTVYLLLTFLIVWGVKFVIRILSLSKRVDRLVNTGVSQTHRLESRLNLQDPAVFGQAVLMVGAVLLGTILWRYWPFVNAFTTASIDTVGAERFLALQPRGPARTNADLYQIWLMLLLAGFVTAIARIQRLRAQFPLRRGGTGLVLVCALSAFTVLWCVVPYRVTWAAKMPLLDVAGERCYQIGQNGDELLIHCPDRKPLRNQRLKNTYPRIRDVKVVENIFTPREMPH